MPVDGEYKALPPDEAIAFLRQKLSLPTRAWTDLLLSEHDRAFVVAGATKMDLIGDLRSAVDRALADGTTLEQFRKDFDEAVARHGWNFKGGRAWRTRIIYQTNLSTAYAAGREAQMRDPDVLKARPYWLYRHGGSTNPREQHLAWDNLVLPADDPFWETHSPPNGWGCSCRKFSLSKAEVEERGLKIAEAPAAETYEWANPNTGEVLDIPKGIDPGWNYAPGEAWQKLHVDRLEGAAPGLARLNVGELVDSDVFGNWINDPVSQFPVGVLDEQVKGAINAVEQIVSLSADTMQKQLKEHPELKLTEYRLLPELIDFGRAIQDGDRTVVFLYRDKRLYVAAVKSTKSGRGLFVTSFRRADRGQPEKDKEMQRLMRRGTLIREWKEEDD